MDKFKPLLDRVKSLEPSKSSNGYDPDPETINEYADDCGHTTMAEVNGSTFCVSCGVERLDVLPVMGDYRRWGCSTVRSKREKKS